MEKSRRSSSSNYRSGSASSGPSFGISSPPTFKNEGGGGGGGGGSGGGGGRRHTCFQRCLSRLTVLASLISLILLIVSITTDRWMCTTEPIPTSNSTEETCYLVTFQSGLWRTCATVNWTNTSNSIRVSHSLGKCAAIPLWLTAMNSSFWKAATFSGSFLSDMRLSTPFMAASVLLVGLALLTSLIGHCLQDVSTLLAAIFLILAGLALGGGLIIYIASLSSVYEEYAYFRKSIVGVRLYYSYGLSFYGACLSLLLQEVSALLALLAYLGRFRSDDELLRLIPGAQRRLNESANPGKRRYPKISKTDSYMTTFGKEDSRRTLKEDLTSDSLTQIECVTVAL